MWQEVSKKKAEKSAQPVTCAWQPETEGGEWAYQVLIHWPDGVWTDTDQNKIEPEEMPSHFEFIYRPKWTVPNAALTGAADSTNINSLTMKTEAHTRTAPLFFCLNCRRDYPIADKRKWRGQVRCVSCCDRAADADRLRIIKAAAEAFQKMLADRENNA